jgi:hypothetical protein
MRLPLCCRRIICQAATDGAVLAERPFLGEGQSSEKLASNSPIP